jgi:hypothetical protein
MENNCQDKKTNAHVKKLKSGINFLQCVKPMGEGTTEPRLVLSFHLTCSYFNNALTLMFYPTCKTLQDIP